MSHKRSRASYEDHAIRPPFVVFGTPLPHLDSDTRDDGSYVPVWKQDVRDERGRKRLHGAFTGGFSAGYFNTVGSKEGWSPATFVSSQAQRHQDAVLTNDDKRMHQYMDDEDLADLKESQKLETQGSFAGLGATGQASSESNGPMLDLFKPVEDTIGIKLLHKMGWRQGQGIGAKIKKTTDNIDHSLAPKDTPMISFHRKTDSYGLGYLRGSRLEPDRGAAVDDDDDDNTFAKPSAARKAKPAIRKSGAFGVGVLNDNGSDDEDPYELGPKITYNKIIGGSKKKKIPAAGTVQTAQNLAPGSGSNFTFRGPKAIGPSARVSNLRRCHDGRLPIDGFILSTRPASKSKAGDYAPPAVPPGWSSRHLTKASSAEHLPSVAEISKSSTLNPGERAAMLGEAKLPGKSVFDYMTPATRAILVAASGRQDLPQAKSEVAPEGYVQPQADQARRLHDMVPKLDKSIAQEAYDRARSGWLPYSEDLEKRSRYRTFIELAVGMRTGLPIRAENASTEDWTNEMHEFVKAAQVFRPVSGLMASRFTSSKTNGQPHSTAQEDNPDAEQQQAPAGKDEPAIQAAKMNMYGPLTRMSEQWYPTRLACKRFGVKPPDHVAFAGDSAKGTAGQTGDERLDVVGKAAMSEMQRSAAGPVHAYTSGSNFVSGGTEQQGELLHAELSTTTSAAQHDLPLQREAAAAEGRGAAVDVEVNEAIEGQRAGEDMFRAVFGDSSDDDK